MAKSNSKDLLPFLKPFSPEVRQRVLWIQHFVSGLYPKSNLLIYDNYNDLAFGWSVTDRVSHLICNGAVWRKAGSIHFGFYWGAELSDPEKRLIGQGKQYRYILVDDENKFPKAYMKKLMKEAYSNALAKVKDESQMIQGKTLVKSVSVAKRTKKDVPIKKKAVKKSKSRKSK